MRKIRDRVNSTEVVQRTQAPTPTEQNSAFLNHLNALRQPRNMKTRRLAQAEDDPELTKTAKLANLLRDLWNVVVEVKGKILCCQIVSFLVNYTRSTFQNPIAGYFLQNSQIKQNKNISVAILR